MSTRTNASAKIIPFTAPVPTPKRASKPRAPRAPKSTAFGVVAQVQAAFAPANRLAAVVGFLLGGFVPFASFVVAHYEIDRVAPLYGQWATLLVLGGLAYSAKTVFEWGKLAFRAPLKAAGFVVLVEGVMVLSTHPALAIAALAYLVAINGVATGCTLATRETGASE